MNAKGAPTDTVSAHDGSRQREAAIRGGVAGSELMSGEKQLAMGDIDFSRLNLQYLISARDLARDYPERAAVLLGVSDALAQRLAELSADSLAAVVAIKAPLLIPRQEPWWWERLFSALQAGRPEELRCVLQQAGLLVASARSSGVEP